MLLETKPYPPHEITDLFPFKTGQALDDLAASIKEHGLLEYIVLYDGKVLDGRRRQAACIRAGVKPIYRDFGNRASDGFSPLDWAFAVNFDRRDLSKAERALAAAKFANMKRGHNQHTNSNGTKPVSKREAAKLGIRSRVVPAAVGTKPIKPRMRRFVRGQFDPDAAADLTPEQLDYAQAAIRCQQLNGILALTFSQQHAVMVSQGYRRTAEPGPLPKFETGAGRPSEKP